jgi:hypothetical protein
MQVNENTDTFVVEKLSPALREGMTGSGMQWTDLCAATFQKMHALGVTRSDFESCLASLPMFDEHVEALRLVSESGAQQAIISDSNTFFIETILSARQLSAFVNAGVHTNPSSWTADGALSVGWLQPRAAPHGCRWSPPNMCKGDILEALVTQDLVPAGRPGTDNPSPPSCTLAGTASQASETAADGSAEEKGSVAATGKRVCSSIVYVGDGRGDLSACLRMAKGDHILARRGFSLYTALTEDAEVISLLKAAVHPWGSGQELLSQLKALI